MEAARHLLILQIDEKMEAKINRHTFLEYRHGRIKNLGSGCLYTTERKADEAAKQNVYEHRYKSLF